ncbi:hypothetical protein [Deinococcus yunweiensis]|uniref:hypothetical protein n=1 Tax=Deinococcus yunweiensis TaxID=367282 RepID=UPI00398EB79B
MKIFQMRDHQPQTITVNVARPRFTVTRPDSVQQYWSFPISVSGGPSYPDQEMQSTFVFTTSATPFDPTTDVASPGQHVDISNPCYAPWTSCQAYAGGVKGETTLYPRALGYVTPYQLDVPGGIPVALLELGDPLFGEAPLSTTPDNTLGPQPSGSAERGAVP